MISSVLLSGLKGVDVSIIEFDGMGRWRTVEDERIVRVGEVVMASPPLSEPASGSKPKPFRALQPRPATIVKRPPLPYHILEKQAARLRNPISGCFVPFCTIRNCPLRTHRQFSAPKPPTDVSVCTREETLAEWYAYEQRKSVPPVDAGIDEEFTLPVHGLEDPKFQHLFKKFLDVEWPRIFAILTPPPLDESDRRKGELNKRLALQGALSDPVRCMANIASAHLQILFKNHSLQHDRTFLQIQAKTLKLLRTRLEVFTVDEVDNLIRLLLTIVQFDQVIENHGNIEGHRKALAYLVHRRGGVHNLGMTLHYALNIDRMLAIYAGKPPIFAHWIDRGLLTPPRVPLVYGSSLSSHFTPETIEPDVKNFCFDVCRAVELMEAENLQVERLASRSSEDICRDSFSGSNVHYLYFLKSVITNAFVHLQANSFALNIRSRPVLFVANIVSYITLQDNYLLPFTTFMANKVVESLYLRPDFQKEWPCATEMSEVAWIEVLIWILSLLISLPVKDWDRRTWTQYALLNALDIKYDNDNIRTGVSSGKIRRASQAGMQTGEKIQWPSNWASWVKANARKFVWSDTHLNQPLNAALQDVQRLYDGKTS